MLKKANKPERKQEYAKSNKKARKWSNIGSVSLFAAGLVFFGLLGMMLPLRPAESAVEQRELAKFPDADAQTVLNGQFFSKISEWYSDSFPLRDLWMSGSDAMKECYGIRTVQIIQKTGEKDEIPDPVRETKGQEETVSGQEESTLSVPEESQPDTGGTDGNTEQPTTMAPITAQAQNGLLVNGDTAYGIYYFNRTAADTYISTVNRTAEKLAGQADVYCMLVPISSTFYLDEATLATTDGSDEKQAMAYYYGSLAESVKTVPIYDALDAHKSEYIYFRTDHHWTGLGAYYAYREWAGAKGIQPHELGEYEEIVIPGFLGSYYSTCKASAMEANPDTIYAYKPLTVDTMTFIQSDGLELNWPIIHETPSYSCFAGSDNPYSVIHNSNVSNGQSCVVIKESYGNALIPYLADHYETIYWFDYRYYNGDIISFIREQGVNDVIFVNGTEPITSIESMNRLSGLLP